MLIRLLTIANKLPAWIEEGFKDYAKRFTSTCSLELIQIPAEKRTKKSVIQPLIELEGEKLLAAVKPGHKVIALEITGQLWSTETLARHLQRFQDEGRHIDLLIGGADGLSPACLQKAEIKWSLSPLTFPHALVRLLVAEQLYRATCILKNHPYHRA